MSCLWSAAAMGRIAEVDEPNRIQWIRERLQRGLSQKMQFT